MALSRWSGDRLTLGVWSTFQLSAVKVNVAGVKTALRYRQGQRILSDAVISAASRTLTDLDALASFVEKTSCFRGEISRRVWVILIV